MTSEPTTRRDGAQERLYRDARDFQVRARRHHQEPEHAVVEEPGETFRRVEEVECVACRRRVDDDEVEAAFVVELVQLLHRHVFLRAAQRAGDVAVERVVEDSLCLLVGRRVARHELVERRLRVEHECRESTAGHDVGVVVVRPQRAVDLGRLVREGFEPEGVGEAPRGIDRDDARVAAAARAFEREHRGRGGLAHAAAPAADQDLTFVDELVELDGHSRSIPSLSAVASRSSCARVMSGLNTNGSSICGNGSRSRRRSICVCCRSWRSARNAAAWARSPASRSETKRSHAARRREWQPTRCRRRRASARSNR